MNKPIKDIGEIILLGIILALFASCSSIQIRPADQAFIAERAGVHAGAALAKKMPGRIQDFASDAEAFLDGVFHDQVLCETIEYALLPYVEDDLLRSDIMAFLRLIEIQEPEIRMQNDAIVRAAVRGFLEGVRLVQ